MPKPHLNEQKGNFLFYRTQYRAAINVILILNLIIAGLLGLSYYIVIFDKPSRYFVTTTNGQLDEIYSLK